MVSVNEILGKKNEQGNSQETIDGWTQARARGAAQDAAKKDGSFYVDTAFRKKLGDIGAGINGAAAPKPLAMEAFAPQAIPDKLPEFDTQRDRVKQQAGADEQANQEALQRRFAAMGALNTGAAIKQASLVTDQADKNKADALGQVDIQEAARKQQLQDKNTALEEAVKGRNLTRESANAQMDFQNRTFNFDANSKLAALEQAQSQIELAKKESDINATQNEYTQHHSGGLFGGGGFLGLGIGT